jgi:hypothetical protein
MSNQVSTLSSSISTQQNIAVTNVSGVLGDEIHIPATPVAQPYDQPGPGIIGPDVDSSPVHLMELPKELRLTIYELFIQDIINEISTLRYPEGPDEEASYDSTMRNLMKQSLALAHTSREIRAESLMLCGKLTETLVFSLHDDFIEKFDFNAWGDHDGSEAFDVLSDAGTRLVGAKKVDNLLWLMEVSDYRPEKLAHTLQSMKVVHAPYKYARRSWLKLRFR